MRNLKTLLVIFLLVGICIFLLPPGISHSFGTSEIERILLKEGEMLFNLKLKNQGTLRSTWPVVTKLPPYMMKPEDPMPSGSLNISDSPLGSSVELKSSQLDGIRQTWMDDKTGLWATIDYGVYSSPKEAQDSLRYIIYQRTIPHWGQNWYSPYPPKPGPVMPYPPGGPYQSANNVPSCRRLNYGDLSYYITPAVGSGGMIYFTRGNNIYMVDSLQQSVEDAIVKLLLSR